MSGHVAIDMPAAAPCAAHAPQTAPGFSAEGCPEPGKDVDIAAVIAVLRDLASGRMPDVSGLPQALTDAIQNAHGACHRRDCEDLARTVAFSIQASTAMAAVARITGEVRETDTRAGAMATAVEELTASISQISAAADQAAAAMATASSQAQEGARATAESVAASRVVGEAFATMTRATQELASATAQISSFAGTIEGLAKQTNLLALNATIEAARAGEAGKGFAVVATEVKGLSSQTQKATDDIKSRISRLETFVRELSDNVGLVSDRLQESAAHADEASRFIHEVDSSIGPNTERMSSIAQVLQQQAHAVEDISRSVQAVAKHANASSELANGAITAVGQSEALIGEQFARLDGRPIPDYVLHRAKSDHALWKKRLSELLVGLKTIAAGELTDHGQCGLGKWYANIKDPVITTHPAFRRLAAPHEAVHRHGRKAAELIAAGDRANAAVAVAEMDKASDEVLRLLDELIRR
ncbi:methyl-accepting chemotaxis protein [Xanthobacteraceae bacterium Astr-EGSB]|uniref:methyl-accepting chemotaxis protein n=1 Tax=Astrobacterium formosum TaxID=3069710 RepID=UPI0027AEE271|nr:methyl-accepting chemotaxis protein [Xanthobacteraceae bacterium Astr-EGSB]